MTLITPYIIIDWHWYQHTLSLTLVPLIPPYIIVHWRWYHHTLSLTLIPLLPYIIIDWCWYHRYHILSLIDADTTIYYHRFWYLLLLIDVDSANTNTYYHRCQYCWYQHILSLTLSFTLVPNIIIDTYTNVYYHWLTLIPPLPYIIVETDTS